MLDNVVIMKSSVGKQNNVAKNFGESDARNALLKIYQNYGSEMSAIVEKMYRSETNHFKSKQYRLTGTGGMEAHGAGPYYGWDRSFFSKYPEYSPVGVTSMFENKGLSGLGGNTQVTDKPKVFIVMPSVEAGMMFKVDYINRYNGNYARWHSINPKVQDAYKNGLKGVRARITESFK